VTDLDELKDGRPSRTRRWLWVIVATLVAVFAIVTGLQWHQLSVLNSSVRHEGDNLVWSFFQLEAEALKLGNLLRDIERHPSGADWESLRTRYEVFVSRVALVEPERTMPHIGSTSSQIATLARVRAFIATTDLLLGPEPRPLDAESVRSILAGLDLLSEPLLDMGLWANDEIAARTGERNEAVRQQNRFSIALTAFQLLLTIAFATIVVRQLHTLEQRGGALERLAARLGEARLEAEAASRTKSAFLANMSHELRTPFQGVLGMLALMEQGRLDPAQTVQLRTARESAQHLLSLLNDVLDMSKIEVGQMKVMAAPTDLHRLVDDVQALMTGTAVNKGLELRVVRTADLPHHVLADATRLKQILFNLVGNAIKFTDRGSVTLEAGTEPAASGPAMLRFAVSDTGVGMDAATVSRLFQRFSQGDDGTSRRHGGTGLGLEISRTIAGLMGGDIEVETVPGAGSCFTLRVPLRPCEAPAPDPAAADAVPLETPPLRVLAAEDHPVNRMYLEAMLERMGHSVTLREDGRQALEAASVETFDLVLMDMHMPVMDGLAATRAIRSLPPPHGNVRIVALTADAFPESREQAADAGMDDFLSKPVQPAELQEALSRWFGRPMAGITEGRAGNLQNGVSPNAVAITPAWRSPPCGIA